MRLMWTDTLAALLMEHDRVPPEQVAPWVQRPLAYRLDEGADPLEMARRLLAELEGRRTDLAEEDAVA